jgi:uncharacterized membrane protein
MGQIFTLVFVAVIGTLGVSTLVFYFFMKAWEEEYAWWARCQDKLASVRLVLSRRKQG